MAEKKRVILSLSEVASLKRMLMDQFQVYMHMHDS